MEKYVKARIEIIEFEVEDVITTSGEPGFCATAVPEDGNDDMF